MENIVKIKYSHYFYKECECGCRIPMSIFSFSRNEQFVSFIDHKCAFCQSDVWKPVIISVEKPVDF